MWIQSAAAAQLSTPAGGAVFDKGSGKSVFGGRGFSLSAGVLNNICNLNPFENGRGDYPRYVQIYLLQWISTRTTL